MNGHLHSAHLRLGVNIDHVATIRNARGGLHPCPLRAAELAAAAGAWVGFGSLGMTLLLATCAALASTLYRQYLNNPPSIGLQTRVPFGSFIAPSTIMIWSVVLWYSQAGWLQAL